MRPEEILNNYKQELHDYLMYAYLAREEKDEALRARLNKIAEMEKRHAEFWEELAKRLGVNLRGLSFRDRLDILKVKAMRKIMGTKMTYRYLDLKEMGDVEKYLKFAKDESMPVEMRDRMKTIAVEEAIHEMIFREIELGYTGEFIYGISDGLVEVLAAVSGFSGAVTSPFVVALGGLIIGVSGSLSMGIGAYLSEKSEEEGIETQRKRINVERELDPNAVKERLEQFLKDVGLEAKAESLSHELIPIAEEVLAKKKGGNPVKGALVTMASYFSGALIPTLPFALGLSGPMGTISSYIAGLLSVSVVGYLIGIASGVNPVKKSSQMTGLALGAALATHVIGLLANRILGLSP